LEFADLSTHRSAEEGHDDKKFPALDGGDMMIFITFWTLNTNLPPSKIAEVAAKLMEKGLFPMKGVKMLGFYICPGGRGITINEMEDPAAASETAFEEYAMWMKELPGLITSWETMPAVSAEKAISIVLK